MHTALQCTIKSNKMKKQKQKQKHEKSVKTSNSLWILPKNLDALTFKTVKTKILHMKIIHILYCLNRKIFPFSCTHLQVSFLLLGSAKIQTHSTFISENILCSKKNKTQ